MSRPFTETLADLAQGATAEELTEGLTELVSAVIALRDKGSMTLKLDVRPNGDNSVKIQPTIKVSPPLLPSPMSFMFVDGNYGLTTRDPRQPNLPLRDVTPEPDEKAIEVEEEDVSFAREVN